MENKKLIIASQGDYCSQFLDMYFESIINITDHIIFIWGMHDSVTSHKLHEWKNKIGDKLTILTRKYDNEDKTDNGRARNFYLKYLQEHFDNEYCLVMDPDEILQFGENIKKVVIPELEVRCEKEVIENIVINVHMRHLISYLNYEDTTLQKHFAPNRFFKINKYMKYPEVEHPVLSIYSPDSEGLKKLLHYNEESFTLFHLAYCSYIFDIRKRYLNHLKKSEMHTPEYLKNWFFNHILGTYPKQKFDIIELPQPIKDYFFIEDDEFYFANRALEVKHFLDALMWKQYFKPQKVLLIGDGLGHRTFCCLTMGMDSYGLDISKWAIKHSPYKLGDRLFQMDLLVPDISKDIILNRDSDLVICYDVLEHINENEIDLALHNLYNLGNKWFLISVPFTNDPNLYADKTHKIFWDKAQWEQRLIKNGFKIKEVPQNFLYRNQLILCEK